MTSRRPQTDERGAAGVEALGVIPLVILAGMIVLQIGVAGWTVVATNQAARDAARAASIGQDPQRAAEQSLPDAVSLVQVTGGRVGDGFSYSVSCEVPTILPFDFGPVTRSADMPDLK